LNILITGGAGFIGSHVTKKALSLGHQVCVLDNESTGRRSNLPPHADYRCLDISYEPILDVFTETRPDVVVHLAAQSSVPVSVKSPLSDALNNVIGTLHVLEAARRTGVRKVIFASTAAVYGDVSAYPIKEEWAGRLLSPYATSKYAGERYLQMYQELYGLSFTIFRFANVYGPRQLSKLDGGVIARFLEKIRLDQVLSIYGDGTQTRDFIYVEDVADAIVLAFTRGDNLILNLSTGIPTSINQLVDVLESVVQKPLHREYAPERPGDIRHSYLCNAKLKQELQWSPRFSLRDGLAHTYMQN
jgi:UDP-glucose 4-epimerase